MPTMHETRRIETQHLSHGGDKPSTPRQRKRRKKKNRPAILINSRTDGNNVENLHATSIQRRLRNELRFEREKAAIQERKEIEKIRSQASTHATHKTGGGWVGWDGRKKIQPSRIGSNRTIIHVDLRCRRG